jgi:integrase/recombinase XerD
MKFIRQRIIDELRLFGYSGMTTRNYVEAVNDLARYHGKSPELLGEQDIKTFLLYSQKRGLAPSSMRNLRCGIVFYFTHVLKKQIEVENIPSMKQEFRLPIILSTSEVERLLASVTDLKYKTMLMTFYATGMRLEELRLLRIENIDSKRMTIKIMGKGKRERYVHLSTILLEQLRIYWKVYKPREYLFVTSTKQQPYHRRSLQLIFEEAKKLAQIKKRGGVHMLRHSYATHLFESGVPAFLIQRLLGHQNIATTQKYVFVAKNSITSVTSPLDLLSISAIKGEAL